MLLHIYDVVWLTKHKFQFNYLLLGLGVKAIKVTEASSGFVIINYGTHNDEVILKYDSQIFGLS